jgi:hypothetical protein
VAAASVFLTGSFRPVYAEDADAGAYLAPHEIRLEAARVVGWVLFCGKSAAGRVGYPTESHKEKS